MENRSQKIDIRVPIIKEKELNFRYFVARLHVYRKIWEPKSNKILEVKLEPTNKMDKLAVAVIKNKKFIGHLQ